MGWNGIPFIRTKGYNEGMLTSYPIKETFSVSQVCFNFNSEQQIQSLIDALNLETAKSELLNKTEKDKILILYSNNHKPLVLARGFVVYSPQ